jgi:phosphoserine aminotransferase
MLPVDVLEESQRDLINWKGSGMSIMEMSHRGKEFDGVAKKAEADLRTLLNIPSNYKVLFLQGGASTQFAMIPLNLAVQEDATDYIVTGAWSKKAAEEGKKYTKANVAAKGDNKSVPAPSTWKLSDGSKYVHYCDNETIGGVEFKGVPDVGGRLLVADMSSNFVSKPVDVSKYGIIYAGAQKNIGPSGLVILIIRDDLLTRAPKDLPSIFRYAAQAKEGSMLNTPNTFAWYLAGLVFKWIAAEGGVEAMATRNAAKASLLYDYIDASGWYSNPVERNARSRMNIPFRLADASLDDVFVKQATAAGLLALKGHRSVGGMRASIYNAMPLAGVEALVGFMRDFAARHG